MIRVNNPNLDAEDKRGIITLADNLLVSADVISISTEGTPPDSLAGQYTNRLVCAINSSGGKTLYYSNGTVFKPYAAAPSFKLRIATTPEFTGTYAFPDGAWHEYHTTPAYASVYNIYYTGSAGEDTAIYASFGSTSYVHASCAMRYASPMALYTIAPPSKTLYLKSPRGQYTTGRFTCNIARFRITGV